MIDRLVGRPGYGRPIAAYRILSSRVPRDEKEKHYTHGVTVPGKQPA